MLGAVFFKCGSIYLKKKKSFETKKTAFLREVQILCAKVTSELATVVDLVIW